MAVGRSSEEDAGRAGEEAADQALIAPDARLLLVFCSGDYDLEALLASINRRSGDVPLIGCTTAGEIAADGPGDAGVVVTALGGPGFAVSTACAMDASEHPRDAGAGVAGCVAGLGGEPHRVLIMLTDGIGGDKQEIVRGVYGVLGASVPLVGGCAGDDLHMTATHQLYNDRVLSDAVVAAALGSQAPLGIGVSHGWQRVGEAVVVTRSSNNRVFMLDDRPALDVYLERLDPPAEARVDPEAFTGFALTHPLGLSGRSGEDHVRFITEANFDDRSLGFVAEVPQGSLTWFMEGDETSVMGATDEACADALTPLNGNPPLGLVAFDCIARRGVLGDAGVDTEVGRIAQCAGGAPIAGFYTYGEIARTHGPRGFHNQTLVVLAIG